MHIGSHLLSSRVLLAPMAGVTDLPFRRICRAFGAALATSEMLTANTALWSTTKSRQRLSIADEPAPRAMQIAGADPTLLAIAAQHCARAGAQIIDINMGCPAKKVCNKAAGSALLRDEALVTAILRAVIAAVDIPVTLKIRTGWSPDTRNGVHIARIAEDCGIAALAVHGRTRACQFRGAVEYDTIAAIKQSISIPVIANGDIDSAEKAVSVLAHTGADAVMIGRAALGNPWIFRTINERLAGVRHTPPPSPGEVMTVLCAHLDALYMHYGNHMGVRIARKHTAWYLTGTPDRAGTPDWDRAAFNAAQTPDEQHTLINRHFAAWPAAECAPPTQMPDARQAFQGDIAA